MRSTLLLLCTLLAAAPALAENGPMTAGEFDAHTRGRTIWFSENGHLAGGEEYLPNRRVRWVNAAGECMEGHWYQQEEFICFLYEEKPGDPQCWTVWNDPAGLRTVFYGDPSLGEQREIPGVDDPLLCLGPEVGV